MNATLSMAEMKSPGIREWPASQYICTKERYESVKYCGQIRKEKGKRNARSPPPDLKIIIQPPG